MNNPYQVYIDAAMRHATYKLLSNDEGWYGEIPGLQGIRANAETHDVCAVVLRSVLEGWLQMRAQRGLELPPPIDGVAVPQPQPDALLSLVEADAWYGISSNTLRSDANQGKLPATRIGKRWYVRPADMPTYAAGRPGSGRLRTARLATPPPPALESMTDLAAAFGVDRSRLIRAAQAGDLSAQWAGSQWAATRDDVTAYLAGGPARTRSRKPAAPPAEPAPLNEGELIDLYTAAAYAGMKKWTLANYVRRGRLAAKRIGNQWVTTRAAVDAYLTSRVAQNISKKYRHRQVLSPNPVASETAAAPLPDILTRISTALQAVSQARYILIGQAEYRQLRLLSAIAEINDIPGQIGGVAVLVVANRDTILEIVGA